MTNEFENPPDEAAAEEQSALPRRFLFPQSRRVRSRLDFDRIYEQKNRASDAHLLIFGDRSPTGVTRIGLSVSRKNGNSVVRHRIRRLLKEAYRLVQHQVPEGLDLILIPKPGSGSTVEDYQRSLVSLAHKISRRLDQK